MNPVSYLIEGVRSLIIIGWDGEALALGFGVATAIAVIAIALAAWALRAEAGALMRTLPVAHGVAWRMLHNVFTNTSLLIPPIAFPLFFFTAFAGGLRGSTTCPASTSRDGYTAFQFVFVLLQSAAFGGRLHGLRDRARLRVRVRAAAAARRRRTARGIVLGYALAALVRWLVTAVAPDRRRARRGMKVGGGGVDLVGAVQPRR